MLEELIGKVQLHASEAGNLLLLYKDELFTYHKGKRLTVKIGKEDWDELEIRAASFAIDTEIRQQDRQLQPE